MAIKDKPRIVLFDIETLPILKQVLRVYPKMSDYPGRTMKASITSVISFGYKELGDKKTHIISAWDFKTRWRKNVNDDYAVLKKLSKVIKEADAIITHNGRKFDWKALQTRLLINGLPPLPSDILHVDTCAVSRKNLLMFSNALGELGIVFKIGEKLDNGGWELWEHVHERKKIAQRKMDKYCKRDVTLLEKLYLKLRPFCTNIPNYGLFSKNNNECCPRCGSLKFIGHGSKIGRNSIGKRFQCKNCGHIFNGPKLKKKPKLHFRY